MTEIELAPCPFEHEVVRGVSTEIDDEEWSIATVICGDCGTRGPYVDLDDYPHHGAAEAAAVRLWNTRPEAADKLEALSGRISMLTEALKKTTARCAQYADFIEHGVKGDDFELHPYFPQLQDEVAEGIAALAQTQSEG